MPKKYFCEYCGSTFHTPAGPLSCVKLPVCRALNYPPAHVVGSYRIRACAILLARTAGDMLEKSPAARSCVRTQKMGQGIKKWSDRAYKALEANTPISLGRATQVHRALGRFVQKNLWGNRQGIPNLYLLELAGMYVDAAKVFVEDRIESGGHKDFWFEREHSDWLAYDAISMPLAIYMAEMHKRRQTSGNLDRMVKAYNTREAVDGPPAKGLLEDMLDHCWRDELRSWRYLEGCMATAAKHILEHGTDASKDLSKFDVLDAYNQLYDHIWGEGVDDKQAAQPQKKLKVWLVGGRFWVAAARRKDAPKILMRDTGHVASDVQGVDPRKKLFDEHDNEAGTVSDMLAGVTEPQFIGVSA